MSAAGGVGPRHGGGQGIGSQANRDRELSHTRPGSIPGRIVPSALPSGRWLPWRLYEGRTSSVRPDDARSGVGSLLQSLPARKLCRSRNAKRPPGGGRSSDAWCAYLV